MKEIKAGCGNTLDNDNPNAALVEEIFIPEKMLKEEQTMIKVGKAAPVFSTPAFLDGKFVNVSLEEFKGQWVYLCFYPGDFTFV